MDSQLEHPSITRKIIINVSLKNENYDYEINVPSVQRSAFYRPYLESLCESILKEKTMFTAIVIRSSAIVSLLEDTAIMLDKQVIHYIVKSIDVTEYVKRGIKYISVDDLILIEKIRDIRSHLDRSQPQASIICQRLTDNKLATILQFLRRINKDADLLKTQFLPAIGAEKVRVIRIKSSGSNFHRKGHQVLMVTIAGEGKKFPTKIIYKPGPMEADALLLGDIRRLKECMPSYKDNNCFSILEIVNRGLKDKIPLYFILPMVQGDGSKIDDHYGYVEYIKRDPDIEIDAEQIIMEHFQNLTWEQKKNFNPQKLIVEEYEKQLSNCALDDKCEFITDDQEKLKSYSFSCGVMLAISIFMRVVDRNSENSLVAKWKNNFIDMETCFYPCEFSLDGTNALDQYAGCMSIHSTSMHIIDPLLRLTSGRLFCSNVKLVNKNLLYLNKNGLLEACRPLMKYVYKGIKETLRIFITEKEKINNWFELPQVQSMYVRVVPYATAMFERWIEDTQKEEFNRWGFLLRMVDQLKEDIYEYDNAKVLDPQPFSREFMPVAAICHVRNSSYIYEEIASLSVPVYYAKANEHYLYNGNSKLVKIDSVWGNFPLFSPLKLMDNYFFPTIPLQFVKNTLTRLIKDNNLQVIFLQKIKVELAAFSELLAEDTGLEYFPTRVVVNYMSNSASASATSATAPASPPDQEPPSSRGPGVL